MCCSRNVSLLGSELGEEKKNCLPSPLIAVCRQYVGDKCVDVSTIRRWGRQFKEEEVEEANVRDKAMSEKGMTATDVSHEERA